MSTILAAFDDRHAAQMALHRLAHEGIARDDLHIEHDLERLKAVSRVRRRQADTSVLGALGRVFGDLVKLNVDHHHVDVVTEAVERGAIVLVARTPDSGLADRAAALLKEAGAFSVGVHAAALHTR
ncbi:hypothetical protein EZ313_21655 [Ramlibacter henchirensis]|jgi:hypothetical protein|uniref:Uncharacterized protein n=1 Tax=Ramlibacter henchirensis TaxID=204072 RepID=A0A4Z0BK51_9BURK|nr:hypothetical protein [Ramlibacter henchirensis]TFY99180.1 hypothetical protein EZ313_21655 [Ramlibacter henchirensis]